MMVHVHSVRMKKMDHNSKHVLVKCKNPCRIRCKACNRVWDVRDADIAAMEECDDPNGEMEDGRY